MKTNLFIIRGKDDEVIDQELTVGYKSLPKVTYLEMQGDHNFLNPTHRDELIQQIHRLFHDLPVHPSLKVT